jgi:DNA invertase Pin-like site-specific DNA recombinase
MTQKLAISYVRFSTMGQSDGDSIRRQTEATEAYCKKYGLILTDAYRLLDSGKSAFKGANRSPTGALGQLEKQVEEGKIPTGTVLIVESLDRLSREDIVSAQLLLLNLINKGLEIVALSDNERRYSKQSLAANPFELIISIMVMSRAHEESKIKSFRVKESWLNRNKLAAEGKHINIRLPSWLESKDKKYIVAPEKASVIKRIFKLYLEGFGTQTIAQMLIKEKVPNIAKSKSGKKLWHPTYVQRIIKSKEVIGYYTGATPEVPNFFPAIISEVNFYAAQAKIKLRNKYKGQRNHNPHPFTHLLKCAICGESIVRSLGNGYQYFQCNGARLKFCKPNLLSVYCVETALLKVIKSSGPAASRIDDDSLRRDQKEMDAIHGKVVELDLKIATATKLFMDTPSETGTKILLQMELEKKDLAQQLEEKRNSKYLIDYRSNWKEVKMKLEAAINRDTKFPLDMIPVSMKITNGELEFLRHTATDHEHENIALRETLRGIVDKISIDCTTQKSLIQFKSGEKIDVEFKKNTSYPRTYAYRLRNGDWVDLGQDPTR